MVKNISVTKDYYECERCNVSTDVEYRLCPCNRKVCEAKKMGSITITKTIIFDIEDSSTNKNGSLNDIDQIMASMNL